MSELEFFWENLPFKDSPGGTAADTSDCLPNGRSYKNAI